jgi:hypothetical protein
MANVEFEVDQRKYSEHSAEVPDEIIEKGDEAIREYLWKKGHIDQALDYCISSNTEVRYMIKE